MTNMIVCNITHIETTVWNHRARHRHGTPFTTCARVVVCFFLHEIILKITRVCRLHVENVVCQRVTLYFNIAQLFLVGFLGFTNVDFRLLEC
jgi:hypothetical protein